MRFHPLACILFLTGCAGNAISGVWAVQVPGDVEDECTDDVSHNFDGAEVVSDDSTGAVGGVQIDESSESSPSLIVVAIEASDGTNATLLIGNELYPGTKSGDGWVFTWEKNSQSEETQSYKDYTFSSVQKFVSTTTWTVTTDGDTMTATVDASSESTSDWSETDTWGEDAQILISQSQIPAGLYLTVTRQGTTVPETNSVDKAECGGSDCSLKVKSTCDGSNDLTGNRTGYETEDLTDKVITSGQSGGI